jgi:hypothetical protein
MINRRIAKAPVLAGGGGNMRFGILGHFQARSWSTLTKKPNGERSVHSADAGFSVMVGRVAQPLVLISVCTIHAEGAPSLRSLQRWAAMLPTSVLLLSDKLSCPLVRGSRPSQRNAKDGAPTGFVDASEIKSLGHPPVRGHLRCRQ